MPSKNGKLHPKDPFDQFFNQNPDWIPEKKGLLDIPNARRWMKVVGWGSREDLYTYQQALEGRSGALVTLHEKEFIMLSAYDYLGLVGHPQIEEASVEAIRQYGTGTGGVRLLTGSNELHRCLERKLADFKGTEAALTFSSGYMANLAAITALLNQRDLVLADEYIHRSLIDALEMGKVPYRFFAHNDMEALEMALQDSPPARRKVILVEGTYSMDGDLCPLPQLVELKQKYGAFLFVDEAHSFGVLGEAGRGVNEHFGIEATEVDLYTGSLSKAIPANGGFIAGSNELVIYLQHGSAPFMFSAALCPAAAAAALKALEIVKQEGWRRERLKNNIAFLKKELLKEGFQVPAASRHIMPLILGADEQAYRVARQLFEHRILTSAVVFPAVGPGQARLRLCMTSGHRPEHLQQILSAFIQIKNESYRVEHPG